MILESALEEGPIMKKIRAIIQMILIIVIWYCF